LNDKFSKVDIDLNDRIAFVKHLFGNSSEDYNRVLNQLITFDNFYETRNFIDEMVKPTIIIGKEKSYAERFMDIIEKIPLNELQNTKNRPLPLSPVQLLFHLILIKFPEPRMSKLYIVPTPIEISKT
jgi:hypothetical protein